MKSVTRQKLILALSAEEMLSDINKVLNQHDTKIILDFDHPDKLARLYLQVGAFTPEPIWAVDSRKRLNFNSFRLSPVTGKVYEELAKTLREHEARLVFMAEKPKNQKAVCKLQLHLPGARNYAITLASAVRGTIITESRFDLPGEGNSE